jgi:hypothetical protein
MQASYASCGRMIIYSFPLFHGRFNRVVVCAGSRNSAMYRDANGQMVEHPSESLSPHLCCRGGKLNNSSDYCKEIENEPRTMKHPSTMHHVKAWRLWRGWRLTSTVIVCRSCSSSCQPRTVMGWMYMYYSPICLGLGTCQNVKFDRPYSRSKHRPKN